MDGPEPFIHTLKNDPRTNPFADHTPVDGEYWAAEDVIYILKNGEWEPIPKTDPLWNLFDFMRRRAIMKA